MINFIDYVIQSNKTIVEALNAINKNKHKIVFVLENNKLIGSITDGDVRRAILKKISLEENVASIMKKDFTKLLYNAPNHLVRNAFKDYLKIIPLVNDNDELVDFADAYSNHKLPLMKPKLDGNELAYITDCIKTSWISSQGPYVNKFEQDFSLLHSNYHAISASSGTSGLHLALAALGIGEGDEVIVPDVTFAATINAVLFVKATPVLCEIDSRTWCIDTNEVKKLINKNTKAIIPVHLYGQVCDMDNLIELAGDHDLFVVEDCAESLGSKWKGQLTGTFGDVSVFSFFGNKTITTGEGGMVLFKNKHFADKARVLRDHGMDKSRRYWHNEIGFNYRLTNIQAAIGVAQLERLPEIIKKKLEIANWYKNELKEPLLIEKFPHESHDALHSHWLYTVQLSEKVDRDLVLDELLKSGVEARPVFYPLHQMPPYNQFNTSNNLGISNKFSKCSISLPSFEALTIYEIEYISHEFVNILKKLYEK